MSKSEVIKRCKYCDKKIPVGRYYKIKKFCSADCKIKYFNIKNYYKIKRDPKKYKELLEKKGIQHKIWRTKNREHFNKLVRKAQEKWKMKKAVDNFYDKKVAAK